MTKALPVVMLFHYKNHPVWSPKVKWSTISSALLFILFAIGTNWVFGKCAIIVFLKLTFYNLTFSRYLCSLLHWMFIFTGSCLHPALRSLSLCVAEVSLMARGSPFLHLSLSFSHNKPPALSHWSSDKIIPLLFPPSTPSYTSWLKRDPAAAGNGHLQHSFLSLPPWLSCTICLSTLPSSTHTWNRSQIISSTLSVVRQLLSLLVTSSHPAAVPCLTLSGTSSIISIPHTQGVTNSCMSPRLTSLQLLVCNS